MSVLNDIWNAVWSERVWLPAGIHWSDIRPGSRSDLNYADSNHLLYPIAIAFVMIIVRKFLERFCFEPIGLLLGLKNRKPERKVLNGCTNANMEVLETAYLTFNKDLKYKDITGLAKQLDVSERVIERWLRKRAKFNKPTKLVKFSENAWRFFYYLNSFAFGVWVLWDKHWLWDIVQCFQNYPHHTVHTDVWWYYMTSMSFYWSLCVSQFFDVKRKDFWQMFVHHIATISLMCFSWICNLHRIGSIVLVVHDCADIFLEAAKMAKYTNYQKTCDILFGVFIVTWMITRLGLFPFWIIYNTSVTAMNIVPLFPAYFIFNGLLIALFLLHIFWTKIILQIAIKSISSGKMEKDIRSESDSESDT